MTDFSDRVAALATSAFEEGDAVEEDRRVVEDELLSAKAPWG
jgi:hypothetical protein